MVMTVKKLRAQFILQQTDSGSHIRLHRGKRFGGLGETSQANHGCEQVKVMQIHGFDM
jgi:hypothetical protein